MQTILRENLDGQADAFFASGLFDQPRRREGCPATGSVPRVCRRCTRRLAEHARFCGGCGLRARERRQDSGCDLFLGHGRRIRRFGTAWMPTALRCFRLAAQADSKRPEPILEIARTYQLMGCPRRARRWFRRAARRGAAPEAWIEGARSFSASQLFRRVLWLARAISIPAVDFAVISEFNTLFRGLRAWQRLWIARSLGRKLRPLTRSGIDIRC